MPVPICSQRACRPAFSYHLKPSAEARLLHRWRILGSAGSSTASRSPQSRMAPSPTCRQVGLLIQTRQGTLHPGSTRTGWQPAQPRAHASSIGLLTQIAHQWTSTAQTLSAGQAWLRAELLVEGTLSKAGDTYAFGCLVWSMITGSSPWPNSSQMQVGSFDPAPSATSGLGFDCSARLSLRLGHRALLSPCLVTRS